MSVSEEKRNQVQNHYGKVGTKAATTCCSLGNTSLYDPKDLMELPVEVLRASRGCADPHSVAKIQEGQSVLDLGSGGGIDAFIAAREVGHLGKVVGIDMTDEMISISNAARDYMGFSNVEFVKGYIEDIPFEDNSFDVVISNCVINLSTDKLAVLDEAFRVLKPGGRFAVADMLCLKDIGEEQLDYIADFFGCISGVMLKEEYEAALLNAGFSTIEFSISSIFDSFSIQARAQRKGGVYLEKLAKIDLKATDEAIASALIVATKL